MRRLSPVDLSRIMHPSSEKSVAGPGSLSPRSRGRLRQTFSLDAAVADLVEFLDVAVRVLDRCAAGPGRWTAVVLTVRQESDSIGALLVDPVGEMDRADFVPIAGA